jgi:predicted Rossmann fold flavoprotein
MDRFVPRDDAALALQPHHELATREDPSVIASRAATWQSICLRDAPYTGLMENFDAIVIGAGAAGLFCAGQAGQRGLRILLIDHSAKVAEKIRISGGGRCNFTNTGTTHAQFLGENPNFCRSALARYTPQDFVDLLKRHGIGFHEKHKGQLFCDRSAQDIIDLLLAQCELGRVQRWQPCAVHDVACVDGLYRLQTDRGPVQARQLVVATGGLSIPKIGASDLGYRIARQFDLRVIPPRPALVPLVFEGSRWPDYPALAGVALPVRVSISAKAGKSREPAFEEDLLFTHRGLSGPAVLQISSYWQAGLPIRIALTPHRPGGESLQAALLAAKSVSRRKVANELAQYLPARLAEAWTLTDAKLQQSICDVPDKALSKLAQDLSQWEVLPSGTEGYGKAEVTAGGVDTRELSSQTLESKQSGLYFIGEVVDVTGGLGGYNFQWAWASAHACAMALSRSSADA